MTAGQKRSRIAGAESRQSLYSQLHSACANDVWDLWPSSLLPTLHCSCTSNLQRGAIVMFGAIHTRHEEIKPPPPHTHGHDKRDNQAAVKTT